MPSTNPAPKGHASLPAGRVVPLDVLLGYVKEVLSELANHRDVMSDEAGQPLYRLQSSGMTPECTWHVFEVDFSAIGMATDMPLIVQAYADAEIEWHFGPTPIATTPRTASPKAVADALDMNVLLGAFHRFVLAENAFFPSTLPEDAGK
jgi:hypothetical protein